MTKPATHVSVTVDPTSWRTSSRSAGNGNCVEVATTVSGVAVRDSKNPEGPALTFGVETWRTFLAAIKVGEL